MAKDGRLRVLLVDDDEDEYVITKDHLSEIGGDNYVIEWCDSFAASRTRIADDDHDVYLIDYRLGAESGLELVREAISRGSDRPFILLTGQGDREVDIEAQHAGVADYLVKQDLTPSALERSMRYAVERRRADRQMRWLANFDPLTGLPNRNAFNEALGQAIDIANREQSQVSLLLVDLDNFKDINISVGHRIGDTVLRRVAERLTETIGENGTIARLGGDEFGVILPSRDRTDGTVALAERIMRRLDEPFLVSGYYLRSQCSIGIATYPGDDDDELSLLQNAELAMFEAKGTGRGDYRFFEPALQAETRERHELARDMRLGLERGEFQLIYQPIYDLVARRIVGAEALMRWHHPDRGQVPPSMFVPLAEDTGWIIQLGEWALHTACAQMRSWQELGVDTCLSVNLSPRQFRSRDIIGMVKTALDDSNLPGSSLSLEVTESSLMEDSDKAVDTLLALRKLGIKIYIDDFGVGYSSLSHLRLLPVDLLKIDRAFVTRLEDEPGDRAVVDAILKLAEDLQLDVIAEGVETVGQSKLLADAGCRKIQGYLVSRPAPADELEAMLIRPAIERASALS